MLQPRDEVGRFVIGRLLGSGGMGQVYEAWDPRIGRNIALKVLRLDERAGPGAAARLLREAHLADVLDHPNVVAIHESGAIQQPGGAGETMYLAMELVAGRSLRAYVGDASVPVLERVRWLRDVAGALAAAHARGIVHRDVKPENVMVREDGVVKVLDFGVAKLVDPAAAAAMPGPTTTQGTAVGTRCYMAPEQMRGEPLDGRADQFAWGVMAYELLTGELPWTAGLDSLQLVIEVLSKEIPLLTTKNPHVPTAVAIAVMRAMAKQRDLRFPTIGALLDAIDGGPESSWSRPRPAASLQAALAVTERSPAPASRPVELDVRRPVRATPGRGRSRGLAVALAAVAIVVSLTLVAAHRIQGGREHGPVAQPISTEEVATPPAAATTQPPAPPAETPRAPVTEPVAPSSPSASAGVARKASPRSAAATTNAPKAAPIPDDRR